MYSLAASDHGAMCPTWGAAPRYGGTSSTRRSKGMRINHIAVSVAVASLVLATGALADHKPGHNPGQGNADVTISATSPIVWGRATVITGTVRMAGAGVLVDLQSDPFPFTDAEFAKETTVPTD